MIYIPKKYREAQLVLTDGRANGHLTLDLSGAVEVDSTPFTIKHLVYNGMLAFVFLRLLRLDYHGHIVTVNITQLLVKP